MKYRIYNDYLMHNRYKEYEDFILNFKTIIISSCVLKIINKWKIVIRNTYL